MPPGNLIADLDLDLVIVLPGLSPTAEILDENTEEQEVSWHVYPSEFKVQDLASQNCR